MRPRAADPAQTQFALGLRQVRRNRLAMVGLVVVLLMLSVAVLGPILPLADPLVQNMSARVQPPSQDHVLGTDHLGRDVLSRLVRGARVSLLTAGGSVMLAFVVGLPAGLAAGYFGGRVEAITMRLMDAVLSFPAIVLAIALVAALGSGTLNVMLAIGLVNAPVFARLVRAVALSAKAEEYAEAARALGATDSRIMIRHVLPSAIAPVTVQVGASFAVALIAEATLSFLGLGTQAPHPSWGMMLNDARQYITDAPWLVFLPALWISVAVLAVNFFGDGLRDALDPRYRAE